MRSSTPDSEIVQVPAQARDDRRALRNEILAVVDQELQLAQLGVVGGTREVGLAQGGARHREGVDRVGHGKLAEQLPAGAVDRGAVWMSL